MTRHPLSCYDQTTVGRLRCALLGCHASTITAAERCSTAVRTTNLRATRWSASPHKSTLHKPRQHYSVQGQQLPFIVLSARYPVSPSYLHTPWDPLAERLLQERTGPQIQQLPTGTSSFLIRCENIHGTTGQRRGSKREWRTSESPHTAEGYESGWWLYSGAWRSRERH